MTTPLEPDAAVAVADSALTGPHETRVEKARAVVTALRGSGWILPRPSENHTRCVLCYYDPGLRPPPDGEPRLAVFVVNGLSTCEEHMGEAVIGPDLNRAIHSMKTQMRLREESSITREGTW